MKVYLSRVASRCRGMAPGEESCPRGRAEASCRVGVSEVNPRRGEPIHVWGDRLFVVKCTDPVVHVVHREEDDIRRCFCRQRRAGKREKEYCNQRELGKF